MIDETTAAARNGIPVKQIRLFCEGTREYPHERAQTHLFAHPEGNSRPDGRDTWDLVSGLRDWQYVTADNSELDEHRGHVLTSTKTGARRVIGEPETDDVRTRLILKCGYCPRRARVLRSNLERLLSAVVNKVDPVSSDIWEIELMRFDQK